MKWKYSAYTFKTPNKLVVSHLFHSFYWTLSARIYGTVSSQLIDQQRTCPVHGPAKNHILSFSFCFPFSTVFWQEDKQAKQADRDTGSGVVALRERPDKQACMLGFSKASTVLVFLKHSGPQGWANSQEWKSYANTVPWMYALPLFHTATSKHHTLDEKRKNLFKFAVLYLQFVRPKGCNLVNLQTLEDIREKFIDHMTGYINSITSFLAFWTDMAAYTHSRPA